MKTPIVDFINGYTKKDVVRLHMPGHKGNGAVEQYDITEISGADSLYEANGIIHESEQNAGSLFGAYTFYSAEGSSLSIRAAMYLLTLYARSSNKRPTVWAARNAHKTFITSLALLDIDVNWIYPTQKSSYISCNISADEVESAFKNTETLPTALYLTSPDYLGNILDIKAIGQVCHKYGVLLIVDNAHGAYLKFLPNSMHPIDLGADICCDSAHKTLPVLTGGAYLHVSRNAPEIFKENAKDALALFGSTSPSYLILASLDKANAYVADNYKEKLEAFVKALNNVKDALEKSGYELCGNEPLKLTVKTKPYGYLGHEMAEILDANGIVCEFADPDFLVLMLTPEISESELNKLLSVLVSIPKKSPITVNTPEFFIPAVHLSPRAAMLEDKETLPLEQAIGRTLGAVNVACPPAVPILVMGEVIDEKAADCFKYYGINSLKVVKISNN